MDGWIGINTCASIRQLNLTCREVSPSNSGLPSARRALSVNGRKTNSVSHQPVQNKLGESVR